MQIATSKDGTKIAYDKTGHGPAVILIAGAMGTRTFGFPDLAKLLESRFTVYNYDRRGRGDSTDTKPFALECEIEDIEALIDEAGGTASLYGISSGACLALEAAAKLNDKVSKLAMYEAPYDDSEGAKERWQEYTAKLDELIAANKRGDAVELFMRFVGIPEKGIAGMRQSPMWQGLEAVAPTLPYDATAMGDRSVPVELASKVKTHALVIDGGNSLANMPFMRTSAEKLATILPNVHRQTIEGQAHDVGPEALAPVLIDFFSTKS